MKKILLAAAALGLAGAVTVGAVALVHSNNPNLTRVSNEESYHQPAKDVKFHLVQSSDALKKCMPKAKVYIDVVLLTDKKGFDRFIVDASGLPANTSFTTFLLETPGSPFGAAEYIGDITSDKYGKAHNEFDLIVQEAFSSTLVSGKRVRVDLNHVGMWFADPADDDFCFGKGGGAVTPFDGDNEAGVQAFNSSNILPNAPLPAP